MWTCFACEQLADDDDRDYCPTCGADICGDCRRKARCPNEDCPGPPRTATSEDPRSHAARDHLAYQTAYVECMDALDAVRHLDDGPHRIACILADLVGRYGAILPPGAARKPIDRIEDIHETFRGARS